MVEKNFILSLILTFVILSSMGFVYALEIELAPVEYLNRTYTTEVNFTINNTGEDGGNVTELFITLPAGAIFDLDTNYTDTSDAVANFTNFTDANGNQVLVWTNLSNGIIENTTIDGNSGTSQVFGFNITSTRAGTDSFTFNVSHEAGGEFSNQTTFLIYTYFSFDGFVKNETGNYQNNTNITIYGFEEGVNGPPADSLIDSVISDGNGFFQFSSVNSTYTNYKLKLIYFNDTDYAVETATATKVGTVLPPFPSMLYYPIWGAENIDIGLNGSTFYLQEATTLNLTAQNSTGDAINFGYEVVDQLLGFPIESNALGNVSSKQVVVPTNRDYTVMMLREFSQFPTGATCNGEIMSDGGGDICPALPKSNSTIGTTWSTLPAESVIEVTFNLSTSKIQVYGCINVVDNENNSLINVTNIIPRLLPWSGFVIQGLKADDGSLNVSNNETLHNGEDIYDTNDHCTSNTSITNGTAFYNLSLLSGTEYMLEFYAKNGSSEAEHSNGAWDLAGFQNISTATTDIIQNITLYRLLGAYNETSSMNTSLMTVDIYNSTGDTLTSKLGHVTVKIKHPVTGTVSYIIESITNGSFTIPILNGSEWAKVYVFSSDGPPIERTLNLSNSTNFVKLRTIDFNADGDKGLRIANSTGDLETLNASANNLELEFISRRTGCDVVKPAESCIITEMNASSFNPLKALVAGKINMRLKFTDTGVSLLFRDFDMFTAKQPPMFSILNTAPTRGSSNSQLWKFGSFAPPDAYKNVTIVIPYSDDTSSTSYLNDSRAVSVSISTLYEEDEGDDNAWTLSWNITRGDTDLNLTDALIEYNDSAFRNYLTTTGIECDTTDSTKVCYIDRENNFIYMTIPHFTGATPQTSGSDPGASPATTTTGGGSSAAIITWSKTITLTDEQFTEGATKELGSNERARFKILGKWHEVGVTTLTATTATIQVSSETQTSTLSVGEEKKFELTGDNYNDLSVKLDSITNNKASLTIKSISEAISEEAPAPSEEKKTPPGQEKKLPEAAGTTWIWIIVIAVVLVIAAVIIWVITKKRQE